MAHSEKVRLRHTKKLASVANTFSDIPWILILRDPLNLKEK